MIVPGDQVEYLSAEQIAPIADKVDWVVNNPAQCWLKFLFRTSIPIM